MAMFEARGPGIRGQWVVGAIALLFLDVLVATGDAQPPAPAATCPPQSTSSVGAPLGTTPSTESLSPAPERIVACVGAQSITGATFLHWADVARRSGGKHPPPATEVMNEAMGFLISSDWVLAEATDLNIHVSEGEVRHTLDHIRTQQFPKKKEFKAWQKQSGQTVADLLFRVRLNLLSTEIQRHVLAGHRSSRSQQHALKRFVHDFKVKWEAQTYCAPAYAVTDCGHVQAAL
jgi:hypothetical protein